MRVAGTVIWATDLIERRSTSGGGKGRPKSVDYSYSVSFAVALSGRRIQDIGRIWADGKLLRGAGGDFKSATSFRVHHGDEDQAPDPLIASLEGIGETPAFRGIAYALFEDFQLADYGNRIPSLSFELIADTGAVTIGSIASELGGMASSGATPALGGFAATGENVRAAIEPLAMLASLSVTDDGDALRLGRSATEPAVIAREDMLHGEGDRGERNRRSADAIPEEVGISYYEPARDWQTGLQRATIGGPRLRAERIALPAALSAGAAKDFAETRLAALRAARASAKLRLGWRDMALRPGMLVRLAGETGLWKVERWRFEKMAAALELTGVPEGGVGGAAASPGRPVREPDLAHGPTVIHVLDVPITLDGPASTARMLVAAAGPQAGWRRAALSISHDGDASWADAGMTAAPAVMGEALAALAAGGAALFDDSNFVDVRLLNDSMWLESRTDAALVDGANLALVGEELIQFGRAEPLGERAFRLSRLLRGRRGTEWAIGDHGAGERFVLLEAAALALVDLPASRIGGMLAVMAEGLGDAGAPVMTARMIEGAALRPPAPAHLVAEHLAGGDIRLTWVRRSRDGWDWRDGGDAPLAEEAERYVLTINGRTILLDTPGYIYGDFEQAGNGGPPFAIAVRQSGTFAASRPAILTIPA